jgi:mannose-6-phosphate isomerase-like protein (cupin superfamily)
VSAPPGRSRPQCYPRAPVRSSTTATATCPSSWRQARRPGGAFTIAEHWLGPRAPGPPLHYHRRLCDSFYVLEGLLTLRSGEGGVQAPPGSFACFPPGAAHAFRNDTGRLVWILNINAPGGWDTVLRALLAASQDGTVGQDDVGCIAAGWDMIVLE